MASFKISAGTAQGKTWKAEGTNPTTGKSMTIQGGQKGRPVGKKNPDSEKTFDARHEATGMTPKKYINQLRWDNKAEFGSTVNIPDELFTKGSKASAAAGSGGKASAGKSASKAGSKKASPKSRAKATAPQATAKKASPKAVTTKANPKKAAAKKASPQKVSRPVAKAAKARAATKD